MILDEKSSNRLDPPMIFRETLNVKIPLLTDHVAS